MSRDSNSEITRILADWKNGDEGAEDRLLASVYDELKRRAKFYMSRERLDHTLQPTALVHEAFLRLCDQSLINWQDRNHFYGIVSRLMRQILVDHARTKSAKRRGGNSIRFSIQDFQIPLMERAASIVALDEALERLEEFDEKQAKIVEMRFFGGMDYKEIADVFDVSVRTINREWEAARLWLYRELKNR